MNPSAVVLLIVMWLACCASGYGVTHLLVPQHWRQERLLLMPVFGSAVIIFLSSFCSYAGLPLRSAAPLVIGAGLALSMAVYIAKRGRARQVNSWCAPIYANAIGLAAALSSLGSIVLNHSWNPYSDAFTYCSIADYLQNAPYFRTADPGAYHPVLTQMLCYQIVGARMGTNFLLGFFTSLFRSEYSFDQYMPVLALGLWVAVPGFWALCRRVLFLPIKATFIATALYGLHLGIPITNALWGFLPQTWGTAFLFPLICFYVRATSPADRTKRLIAAGALTGIILLSYTEIIPFALLGIGTVYLVRIAIGRLRVVPALIALTAPVFIAVVLAPVAASTFYRLIKNQVSARVGWDVNLHFLDYALALSGFKPALREDPLAAASMIPPFFPGALRILAILVLLTVLYALFRGRARTSRQVVYLGGILLAALAWFSMCASNPWNPVEAGHPWSTYKVVTYSFFLFVAIWGLGISMLWERKGILRLLAVIELTAFLICFPVLTATTAKQQSVAMQGYTGSTTNPTAEYHRLSKAISGSPENTPINLLCPPEASVHRRWVAYFIRRPVVANWSEDGYIAPWLAPMNRALGFDPQLASLVYTPGDPRRTAANMTLDYSHRAVMTSFGEGWYGLEADGRNWWRWLEQQGEMELFVQQEGQFRMRGEIAVVGCAERTITVSVVGEGERSTSKTIKQTWFAPFALDSLTLTAGSHKVILHANGPATRQGRDPRNVRIGIRNALWEMLP